jgi:predicted Ser/Thr protein kinase
MSALNSWLYSQGEQKYEHAKGMVTTFSALVLKSQTLYLFHVGDSRIYRLREGELQQLTRDHRIWINNDREYLSRALGIDINLEIDYRSTPAQEGDIYLLTTDGVHDFVADNELLALLEQYAQDQQQAAEAIVEASKQAKSTDNITCQVVRVDSLAEADKNEYYEQLTRLPFPPDLNAGHIIDGYKILRELNASSRSQVYLAEDTLSSSPRKVVLKTPSVNYEDDPNYLELFLHEEWVAKRLDSPHLIKVCNEDRQRTFLYTVVEYIEGQTLKQWMADNPRPGIAQMRATIDQIARGLRSMHRMEMFHQDLKPDNILIDNNNTLKIIDFGSTRIAGLAEIKTPVEQSHILGTANYSAPEYFRGEQGSNRSDIFSLGVIAYEMLTGKLPYGEISSERAAKKRYLYTAAREHNPMIPEWIDAALEKALQPHPEKRYALLSEFITDLTKPNQRLLQKSTQPLLERNPVAFWQVVALIELIALVTLIVIKVL